MKPRRPVFSRHCSYYPGGTTLSVLEVVFFVSVIVAAMCNSVHDVDTNHGLCELQTVVTNLF